MDLKEKVLFELEKNEFPDLSFLFSKEVLDIALDILEQELETEKQKFKKLLAIENKDLNFESFEEESKLDYFWSLLNHLDSVDWSDKSRKIIEDFRPKLQDFWNEVAYNKDLFEKYIYIQENCDLDEEQKRIMYLRIKSFKDRGIDLPLEKQEKLKSFNKKLSKLSDNFTNNIVDDKKQFTYTITNFEIIKDLPKEVLELALSNFQEKEKDKKWWTFTADPSSLQALMEYCSDEKVRKDIENFRNTVASSWKYDNRENILNILKYKKEKSKILWYKNFAELSLNSKMAENSEQVLKLLENTFQKANKKWEKDIEEIKSYFKLESIASCDLAYYARILKKEKYSLDEKELKKYFELENVLNYLHRFIENFYWLEIKDISDSRKQYNEDVKIYEVYKNNKLISYYFLDTFYRDSKRPWAWANELREKQYFPENKIPIVLNVCNFQKNKNWKTTLYKRDVETIFHEFWHAIHEMLSESKYSELSGFWVEWDFVELPSQLLENWVWEKNSLKKLAKHFETWESITDELIEKLENLKYFWSWLFVARQNEFALLDMLTYSSDIPENIERLDEEVLKIVNKYSIFKREDNYKMYCSFNHIFGWWYAAWYYSYLWAEIIEADIFERIKKMWMFEKETWEKLLKTIIGQGTRKKASELFFDFMWREVDNWAYLKRYWLS